MFIEPTDSNNTNAKASVMDNFKIRCNKVSQTVRKWNSDLVLILRSFKRNTFYVICSSGRLWKDRQNALVGWMILEANLY